MPSPSSPPDRPTLDERAAYIPRARQERFIVPLLKNAIEPAIVAHAVAGGSALDAGCGAQPFRGIIERAGMRYAGLDTQRQPGVNTDYICAIDGELPPELHGRTFDLILCSEVLEHVADWSAAWSNLARLLAPGGSLILTCPFVYPLHEEPYDFFRPTEHAIRHYAAKHGLAVGEYRRLGGPREAIGTFLAASKPTAVSGGPAARLLASVLRPLHKLAFTVVRAGPFSGLVVPVGHIYLSNFAVLRKPSEVAS